MRRTEMEKWDNLYGTEGVFKYQISKLREKGEKIYLKQKRENEKKVMIKIKMELILMNKSKQKIRLTVHTGIFLIDKFSIL